MAFLLEDINSGLLLNASFFSYLPKKIIDKQRVNIFSNNQMTGQWVIGKKGVQAHSLIIPKDHLTGIKMLLEFEFPDARSPKSLNLSPDERVLALAFFKITLERYDPASKQNDTKKDVTNSGS